MEGKPFVLPSPRDWKERSLESLLLTVERPQHSRSTVPPFKFVNNEIMTWPAENLEYKL